MNTWRLAILGASSTISPFGDSTACLHLGDGTESILIDAGGNIPALMKELNLDYRKITGIVFTHSHPDHTYGFPFLCHAFYHDNRIIRGWCPEETLPRLKESIAAYDLEQDDQYLSVDFKLISTKISEEILPKGKIKITTLPTQHSRPGFGLKIETKNSTVIYSGDTAPTETITRAARGADVLIHDCQATNAYRRYFAGSHTSALELGKIAAQADVKAICPFHYNTTELPVSFHELAAEIKTVYDGIVLEPRKGMSFYL